ncbi:hypothetical protein, partial [Citrobacter sp. Res13-Sevr-PEB04-36]|uniref:hypothetical protein n=1 Tax=Citrobacter sp. Res13-Sevr-PEB04-36 TaxID=2777960 RepID=UPI001E410069
FAFSQRRGVCILRHPATKSNFYFAFLREVLTGTPLTRRFVIRYSVSVEAHYRELFQADKRKIQKTYQTITFPSKLVMESYFCLVFKQKTSPAGPVFCIL